MFPAGRIAKAKCSSACQRSSLVEYKWWLASSASTSQPIDLSLVTKAHHPIDSTVSLIFHCKQQMSALLDTVHERPSREFQLFKTRIAPERPLCAFSNLPNPQQHLHDDLCLVFYIASLPIVEYKSLTFHCYIKHSHMSLKKTDVSVE